MEKETYDEAGMEFNINSSQQLGHVLFEKLQLPVQKKARLASLLWGTPLFSLSIQDPPSLNFFPYSIRPT